MNLSLSINKKWFRSLARRIAGINPVYLLAGIATVLAVSATAYSFKHDLIIAYGDAESHLDIAKRIVNSITPGFAQMGGIWLPVPHLLMLPFIWSDFMWRTGLAGSMVSGICYLISTIYIYKTSMLLTKNKLASFAAALVFATNPNILYMQSTPMTELTLIAFFNLSTYYFMLYIKDQRNTLALMLASIYAFIASLSRYDGWFLVAFEGLIVIASHFSIPDVIKTLKEHRYMRLWNKFQQAQGRAIFYGTVACFGILLWMIWDYLILGDPFYFTNSQFSAKTQQQNWQARGELPASHNVGIALLYYLMTSLSNAGVLVFFVGVVGFVVYILDKEQRNKLFIATMLLIPFIFNVFTLYAGQSVIFIPHVTPVSFEWRLFNVRYGVMMIPSIAIFIGFLFAKRQYIGRILIAGFILAQFGLFAIGYSSVISLADGTEGLSSAKRPDAERWIIKNYDHGLVLIDDYARTLSIVRSGIPMQDIIYVGNKPYWDESLYAPEKYARWIITQQNDTVWNHIVADPAVNARLYKYFEKAYTSPEILIFRRKDSVKVNSK